MVRDANDFEWVKDRPGYDCRCKTYVDNRGYFAETYKCLDFIAGGIDCEFAQNNQSSSTCVVLRGSRFQIEYLQAKLVHIVSGSVFDVAVDLCESSPTYRKWEGVVLSAEDKHQFFVRRGEGRTIS